MISLVVFVCCHDFIRQYHVGMFFMRLSQITSFIRPLNVVTNSIQHFHRSMSSQVTSYDLEIFKRLAKNDALLTSLSLSMSQIGPKGAQMLAKSLKTNDQVVEVYLNKNQERC